MGTFVVRGGKRLFGETAIRGAKNAALPALAACLAAKGKSVIKNCPDIADVRVTLDILQSIGCETEFKNGVVVADSSDACVACADKQYAEKMRSSSVFLGAMLARFKIGSIYKPGGCEIGVRPLDIHVKAFEDMGVKVKETDELIICDAFNAKPAFLRLSYPSVGATENVMIFASSLNGTTVIKNAAREPEIQCLADFLNLMGANVKGAGTSVITIRGGKLFPAEIEIIPDRIETATYICSILATRGEGFLIGANLDHMPAETALFRRMGAKIAKTPRGLHIEAPLFIQPIGVAQTNPYPDFSTDTQPLITSVLTTAQGLSIIIETVFESRLKYTQELVKMGANIKTDASAAIICGVNRLKGADVACKDLRGGAALIVAALSANGETRIRNSSYIKRGYQDISASLTELGADIRLIE